MLAGRSLGRVILLGGASDLLGRRLTPARLGQLQDLGGLWVTLGEVVLSRLLLGRELAKAGSLHVASLPGRSRIALEHEGNAASARERGDMEAAGLGQLPAEKKPAKDDLAERDPQAAEVLQLTKPGRGQPAAEQVARAAEKDHAPQRTARKHGQERGSERTLSR